MRAPSSSHSLMAMRQADANLSWRPQTSPSQKRCSNTCMCLRVRPCISPLLLHPACRLLHRLRQWRPHPCKVGATDKAPRTLPPNVWSDAIKKYNSVCLAGVPREFPERILIGAESILARVHWEHSCSKLYTPIELGELLSKRSFTATGEVNMLATRKRKAKLEYTEDDGLEATDPDPWEPRSPWSIIDGLDSIRWCYILFEIGEERQVHKYLNSTRWSDASGPRPRSSNSSGSFTQQRAGLCA